MLHADSGYRFSEEFKVTLIKSNILFQSLTRDISYSMENLALSLSLSLSLPLPLSLSLSLSLPPLSLSCSFCYLFFHIFLVPCFPEAEGQEVDVVVF